MTDQIATFCDDPNYYGQGECSCYLGIVSAGVNWGPPLSTDNGLQDYIPQNAKLPFLLQPLGNNATGGSGQFVRYDAYCNVQSGPVFERYSQPYSYSQNNVWYTQSGPCSKTTPDSPLEYPYQTLNPNLSIIPNYGDIVVQQGGLLGDDPSSGVFPLPMPPYCWLPQCTYPIPGVADDIVFRDLNAIAFAGPCPDICYAVSGNQSTFIGNYGTNGTANIGQNIVSCGFPNYTTSLDPFVLPCDCATLDLQVPANFSGTLNIPIWNFQLDNSVLFSSSMLTATTALYPLLGFWNGGSETAQVFADISKYSVTTYGNNQFAYPATFFLSISINTNGQSQYNGLSSEIVLQNEKQAVMTIPTRITIFGDGQNFQPVCSTCDPKFPGSEFSIGGTTSCTADNSGYGALQQNAAIRASSNVLTGVSANNDTTDVCITNGGQISNNFSSAYPYTRVTQAFLESTNVYQQLLSAHTSLYGQVVRR